MAGPGFTRQPSTRRAFLRRAGLGAAGIAVGGPALLAACTSSASRVQEVRVYNEPLALDDNSPSLFEASTGVFLRYHEYTDPVEYLRRITPALRAHRDVGADVVIVPDLQTRQMIDARFAQPLPAGRATARILPAFAHPRFDPGRRFSLPWSSTIVGFAYDRRRMPTPPRSAAALFDASLKGKVVLSADPAATLGLVMFASGQDPAAVTGAQATAAVRRIRAAVTGGQIGSFATLQYVDELTSGRALLAVARSDEVRDAQQSTPELAFFVPTEGGLLESTNMVVPAAALNVVQAHAFINYMFAPAPDSRLASFGSKVTTVAGADQALQQIDAKASTDPLIVPDPAVWARLRIWGGSSATDAATAEYAALAASHSA